MLLTHVEFLLYCMIHGAWVLDRTYTFTHILHEVRHSRWFFVRDDESEKREVRRTVAELVGEGILIRLSTTQYRVVADAVWRLEAARVSYVPSRNEGSYDEAATIERRARHYAVEVLRDPPEVAMALVREVRALKVALMYKDRALQTALMRIRAFEEGYPRGYCWGENHIGADEGVPDAMEVD